MPRKPTIVTSERRRPTISPSIATASGIMNSGRENCSAMASASSMCVSVQKNSTLPSVPTAPRTKCMPGRAVRNGASGSRMNTGSMKQKPTADRKNRISMVGMRAPSSLTTIPMITSVSEPMETRAAPREGPSIASQRARQKDAARATLASFGVDGPALRIDQRRPRASGGPGTGGPAKAGITSRAKARRLSREPVGPLSSTCSMPAARSPSSFRAISSGVPYSALSPAASSVWSNDSRLDLLFSPGADPALASRC